MTGNSMQRIIKSHSHTPAFESENNKMKLKMETVAFGKTTAKQHDGDVSTEDGGCDHLTSGSTATNTAHISENENEAITPTPQDDSLMSHDDYDYDDNTFEENDIENDNNEHQSLRTQRSPSAPSDRDDTYLPEDTFSFLIYSPVRSRTFLLATSVFLFQIAIYAALAVDITDFSNRYNMLQFPANVEKSVRVAEALAGVVAVVFTQDDTRKAVNLLREGFNQDLQDAFQGTDRIQGITRWKWGLSILLRFFEGAFGIFLTFLLIMQSTTVIELLLNFTAMEFVCQLDDVAFVLTREGFFGRDLKKEAKKVLNRSYPSSLSSESKWASIAAVSYFVVWLGFFFGMYGWISWKQMDGHYFCLNIFAQFGGEVMPILGTLSGLYHNRRDACCHYGGRVSFFRDGKDGDALLAYCEEEERWTISLPSVNVIPTKDDKKCEANPCNEYDPCNWIAASSVSQDFDVLTTADSQWIVRNGPKRISSLSQHFLACHDCIYTDDFCGEDEQFGECTAKSWEWEEGWGSTCECNTDHYGFQCEYQPCQMLEISQRDASFEKQNGTSSFASKYYRLEGVEAYNRPVYTSASLDDDQMIRDGTDIILFTGVRWILSSKDFFPGLKDNRNVSEYFSHFHGHFTDYNASYVSELVYIGRLDDEASPSGLQWLHASYSGGVSEVVSDKEFDQRLQPDLQKGSIETEFCCDDCSNDE